MKVLIAAGALVQTMVAGIQNTQYSSGMDYTYFDPYFTQIYFDEFCPKDEPDEPSDTEVDPEEITKKIEDLIGKIETLTQACEEFDTKKQDLTTRVEEAQSSIQSVALDYFSTNQNFIDLVANEDYILLDSVCVEAGQSVELMAHVT